MKNTKIKIHRKAKLGLVLGGGGGFGVAHIGAIKAFEELGINFKYVAGTSAGSLVGALYAKGMSSEEIANLARSLKVKDIRNSKFILKPSTAENIANIIIDIFGTDLMFSELQRGFAAVCVDMKTGNEVDLNNGSVAKAVSGSCAVPGIFKPVEYLDMHLVDGGLKNNLPTDVIREMGANVVIAIELNHGKGFGTDSLNMFKVLTSSLGIMMSGAVAPKFAFADLVVHPNMSGFSKMNLDDIDSRITLGYNAVMEKKDEILKILKRRPRKKINYGKKD